MSRLHQYWYDARSSFWFVPGLLILGAVVLAIGLVDASAAIDPQTLNRWPLLFGAGAAGSRGLLAAIAGSMITVAGVVFSITLVALSLASSQYTSRVLRNFMRDRINQVVLGVFVGIFAYCLVVLRTIRGGDEGAFVPALAVLAGLLLGFVGIAFLVFFIHHISTSIQASQIIAAVSDETLHAVDTLFPKCVGREADDDIETESGPVEHTWHTVCSLQTGYIQHINTAELLAFAQECGTVIRMERCIGEFVIEGTPVISILGTNRPDEQDSRRLGSVSTVGRQRTIEQDAAFGIRQLVDVALKALSPGINDTTTAVMCIDYLTAILIRLADRRIESRYRSEDGELRVLTRGPTFAGLVAESFDQIRQNAAGNVAVLCRLLWSLETLADRTSTVLQRGVLLDHALALDELVRRSIPSEYDRQPIISRSTHLTTLLDVRSKASSPVAP
ncbi:MAG: DUF2254 domain-containing protein [Acidobacteriota bacterium]